MAKTLEQYNFNWTPVDPNQQIAFDLAIGKGLVTGDKVELWFTVQYPTRELPEYAQINGWDALFNPIKTMNASGSVTVASAPENTRKIPTNCFTLPDRIGFRDGPNVMSVSDIQGQYVSGYITWLIR